MTGDPLAAGESKLGLPRASAARAPALFRAPAILGLVTAVLVAALDQGIKLWLIFGYQLGARGLVQLAPFVDLVLTWNPGISYGLFQQHSALGQTVLAVISAAAIGLFAWWLARATSSLVAVAIGLVIGGAIGNGIDRVAYGAVADFLLLSAEFGGKTYRWYVFNLADAAIVAGVAGLLWDAFRPTGAPKAP